MLSGQQILECFPNNSLNLIRYMDIPTVAGTASNLEDLIWRNGLVILYPVKNSNSGHWCCLFKRSNNIFFFDSYGYIPDDQLNFCDQLSKDKQYLVDPENYRRLTEMLYDFSLKGGEVDYNPYTFQADTYKDGTYVKTCGYHCIARLLLSKLDTDEYYNLMRSDSKVSSDDLVEAYIHKTFNI